MRSGSREGGENEVLTFLEDLFSRRVVLFVGYGLEEMEILEYVLLKKSANGQLPRARRACLLQGFFEYEQELVADLSDYYYEECGVKLIPFSREERDHAQIIDVIE